MPTHYRELVVWQKAMDLAAAGYELARLLPASERYGVTSQLQRAATSVPSNIAEGHERRSTKEYLRFIAIAFGSLAECETLAELIVRVGYLDRSQTGRFLGLADEVGRMLRAIERSLSMNLVREPEPEFRDVASL